MSQWCELTFIMSWLLYIVKVTLSSHSGGIGVVGNPVGSLLLSHGGAPISSTSTVSECLPISCVWALTRGPRGGTLADSFREITCPAWPSVTPGLLSTPHHPSLEAENLSIMDV